ncbi:MAG: hypothetical protein WEA04_03490 [Candidatus Andersenbacteria bacterium]
MTASSTQVYAANRRKFSAEDLAPYQGQWVAFSRDGGTILASQSTILDLVRQLQNKGFKPSEYRLEPMPDLDASMT